MKEKYLIYLYVKINERKIEKRIDSNISMEMVEKELLQKNKLKRSVK